MAKPSKDKKKEREIIDGAIARLEECIRAEKENRATAIEDLQFVAGDQWDEGEKQRREDAGRPALQFNLLAKFVDQVVGDMLHNSPSVKLRPANSQADVNIAKIRQGIISNIEYQSNAKAIYGYAATQQVSCGYGAWRILTRYTDDNPFVQEAYLESIRNPFLVYMDPSAKDQNYADAKFGFVLERMSVDKFKKKYPKYNIPPSSLDLGDGIDQENWYDGETITIAEYFSIEEEPKEFLQLEDGRVVSQEEFDEIVETWKIKNSSIINELKKAADKAAEVPEQPQGAPQGMPGAPQGAPPPPNEQQIDQTFAKAVQSMDPEPVISERKTVNSPVVRHRIITCMDIIDGGVEGNKFPGKYVPIIVLKGKELNVEGKNYVYGLVHHAIDAQKMYNYWQTAAAETIALAPKAPWLGTAKQFEGYENDYASANVDNLPFLKYNSDPEAPGPPQRQAPTPPPVAIFQQIANGENQMKSIIGLFAADLGQPGSEQTGAAVLARQKPGDISTFVFSENLARAVLYTGRVLNEMIPELYDTERDVRIRNADDTETFVPVNTTIKQAARAVKTKPEMYAGLDPQKITELLRENDSDAKFNDITVGKYDIVVTTGPSYATQRQESATHLLQMVQAMPQQMAIAADLIVQNMDFKDADELADRLRKTLPPGMLPPKPGDKPPAPPQPSPEQIAAQAKLEQAKIALEIQKAKLEQEKVKFQHEQQMMQMELQKLKLEAQASPVNVAEAMQEKQTKLRLESERLELEKRRLNHQIGKDQAEFKENSRKDYIKMQMEQQKNTQQ